MTAEQYINMCEQLGEEPDPNKIPKSLSDLPSYIHTAIEIFNALPDNYSGGMSTMYTGKDYGSLEILFQLHYVDHSDRLRIFEVISWLDNKSRVDAQKAAKKAAK